MAFIIDKTNLFFSFKVLYDVHVSERLLQLEENLRDLQESHAKEENALRTQITKLQQERRQLQEAITQYQTNEQTQKQEFDQVLFRAQEMHEMLERETHEKFVSIAEQKSLRQQVENLSKNMKSLQVSLVCHLTHRPEQGHSKTNKQTNNKNNKTARATIVRFHTESNLKKNVLNL